MTFHLEVQLDDTMEFQTMSSRLQMSGLKNKIFWKINMLK